MKLKNLILRRNPRVLTRGMNALLGFLLRRKPRTLVRGAPLLIAFLIAFTTFCYGDDGYYKNDEFSFQIKKIPGWKFSEEKMNASSTGPASLSLTFSTEDESSNFIVIYISKFPAGTNIPMAEAYDLESDKAIGLILNGYKPVTTIKELQTVTINQAKARDTVFEFEKDNKKFISRLIYFRPAQNQQGIFIIQVLSKFLSDVYSLQSNTINESLESIKILN